MTNLSWKKILSVSLGVSALLISSIGLTSCETQGGDPSQEQPAEPEGTN
ncbi:MAG: hypothetical protein ACRC06_10635 [Waterburya sp.]